MSKSKKKPKKAKPKRKLTAAEKRAKRERKRKYRTIFINGKQKRVLRELLIDGLPADEFIARNADPIWLHQNGLWELMPVEEGQELPEWEGPDRSDELELQFYDDEIPF